MITEEAEAFFKGQKTAKEVADIIQSRISMYVKENKQLRKAQVKWLKSLRKIKDIKSLAGIRRAE